MSHHNKSFLSLISSVVEYAAQTNIEGPAIIGTNPDTEDLNVPSTHDKQKSSQSSSHAMGAGKAAGIAVCVTVLAGLLIAVMVIGWRRHKNVKRESSDLTEPLNSFGGYGALHDGGNTRV